MIICCFLRFSYNLYNFLYKSNRLIVEILYTFNNYIIIYIYVYIKYIIFDRVFSFCFLLIIYSLFVIINNDIEYYTYIFFNLMY